MAQTDHEAAPVRPGAMTALLGELMRSPGPGAASWADALEPGAVIGRFELVRELGRGGFGRSRRQRRCAWTLDSRLRGDPRFEALLARGPR